MGIDYLGSFKGAVVARQRELWLSNGVLTDLPPQDFGQNVVFLNLRSVGAPVGCSDGRTVRVAACAGLPTVSIQVANV